MAEDARLLSGVTVLRALIGAQSFTRAATALGLSPSAVSRSVARDPHCAEREAVDREREDAGGIVRPPSFSLAIRNIRRCDNRCMREGQGPDADR